MSLSFYIKRTYIDPDPDIELVNIHYTWTPLGELPHWEAHRETRLMQPFPVTRHTGIQRSWHSPVQANL